MLYYLIEYNGQIVNGTSFDDTLPIGAVECTEDVYRNCVEYSIANGALVPLASSVLLSQAQAAQIAALSAACQSYLLAGFSSSALGSAHTYPSTLTDQQNQASVAAAGTGGNLWCESGTVWSLTAHTAVQATQVVSDWKTYLNAAQTRLQTLITSVNAAATVAAAQAISW
jgi:hypothetical protein